MLACHLVALILKYVVGFQSLCCKPVQLLVDDQRLRHCQEFLQSFDSGARIAGTLVSGPSGVGKTSVGLLTYLACYVRKLPVVYLPVCAIWESQSESKEQAVEYFMAEFFRQNADIIAETPELAGIFEEQMSGHVPSMASFIRLSASSASGQLRCGFIADEIQELREVRGKTFFKSWLKWTTLPWKFLFHSNWLHSWQG